MENISPDYLQEKFERILGIDIDTLTDGFKSPQSIIDTINIISKRWNISKEDNILPVYKFILHTQLSGISPNNVLAHINKFTNLSKISNDDATLKGRVHHLIIREIDSLDIENDERFKILSRVATIDDILFAD